MSARAARGLDRDIRPAAPHAGLWHWLGQQLRRPDGLWGRAVGKLMTPANRGPYRQALAALEIGPCDDVLEIGFGPGGGLAALALATAGVVCGLDHSATMHGMASRRNRAAIAAGRMRLRCGDMADPDGLPWPDRSFDRVLMVNVAYFLGDDGSELAEVRRVLRPGGRLAIYATDRETMRRWPLARSGTHRLVDADDLRRLLLAGGFACSGIRIVKVALPRRVRGLVATAG